MKLPIQIKVEGTRLDLYKDEGIVLKQLIKDFRDPKSLFTDFSRSFTVPASKTNNKLFKHYYNVNISDGIDAREYLDAQILMNEQVYKAGNVAIEGVVMSSGVPQSYKIRFYGNLTEIAKNIGQDELKGLDLSSLDINSFDPKVEFNNSTERDVVFPLSSRNDRFIVDTSKTASEPFEKTQNIWYIDGTPQDYYGFNESNIVGAVKVGKLLEAIEDKYGFTFTGVFEQDYVQKLYFWLHKTDKERSGGLLDPVSADSFTRTSGNDIGIVNNGSNLTVSMPDISGDPQITDQRVRFRVKGTSSASNISITLRENGVIRKTVEVNNTWSDYENAQNGDVMTVQATTDSPDTVDIELETLYEEYDLGNLGVGAGWSASGGGTFEDTITVGSAGVFNVGNELPKMKIIDFLSSLFKMFNIVAEVDSNLNVSTKHYDFFMSQGTERDISEYVDIDSYTVNRGNLYSSFKFEFAKPVTVMEEGYVKVNGRQYGEIGYELKGQDGTRLIGQEYKMKLENQRIPLEPLYDGGGAGYRNIVYTQFSDREGSEQQTSPCFTYVWGWSGSGRNIAWNDNTTVSSIGSYVMPSNIFTNHTEPTTTNANASVGLYFSPEINEQLTDLEYVGSDLLNLFYRGLLSVMFNQNTRNVSFKSHLPLSLLQDLKLSDILRINNETYRINGIETNYLTGESDLDLTLVSFTDLPAFNQKEENIDNSSGTAHTYRYIDTNGYVQSGYLATGNDADILSIGGALFSDDLFTSGSGSSVETLALRYNAASTSLVCTAPTVTVYSNSATPIVQNQPIYSDIALTSFAATGYYSNGLSKRYWTGTAWLGSVISC